jgi:peptidoglycan/LPS O-acetylase OafA/YrhL
VPQDQTQRLNYLDSIRGIAAFYVVLVHARLEVPVELLDPIIYSVLRFLDYGRIAVSVFIVLSGYCLGIPSARADTFTIRGGFARYLFRRARRIYPPFLVAMAISLAILWLLPQSAQQRSFWMTTFQPAFTWDVIASHLFLIHNLSNDWLYKINAPFWSVATEWQIYFALPLMLWMASRCGLMAMTILCGLISLLPMLVFRRFETAAPWYIMLFAMGLTASYVSFAKSFKNLSVSLARGWLCGVGAVTVIAVVYMDGTVLSLSDWKLQAIFEILVGITTALLLIWLSGGSSAGCRQVRLLLESQSLRVMGNFSYSLYLTHAIPLCLTSIAWSMCLPESTATVKLAVMLVVGSVSSLLFAAVFHFFFERPFTANDGKRKTSRQLITDATDMTPKTNLLK